MDSNFIDVYILDLAGDDYHEARRLVASGKLSFRAACRAYDFLHSFNVFAPLHVQSVARATSLGFAGAPVAPNAEGNTPPEGDGLGYLLTEEELIEEELAEEAVCLVQGGVR